MTNNMMGKAFSVVYGLVCYCAFLGVFLYMIGFLGNVIVPKTIDGPPEVPLAVALLINTGLVMLFGLQHSIMARPWFKRWWTRIVPKPVERSTYVLFTSIALGLMYWLWEPMGGTIWHVEHPIGRMVCYSLYAFGWLTVLVTTFMIKHFDLFGLRQVYLYALAKEYTHLPFKMPSVYKYIRHPLYVGWFMAFWATPDMTMAHLAFAMLMSGCILMAVPHEERDLVRFHGDAYAQYCKHVPRFIPAMFWKRTPAQPGTSTEASSA